MLTFNVHSLPDNYGHLLKQIKKHFIVSFQLVWLGCWSEKVQLCVRLRHLQDRTRPRLWHFPRASPSSWRPVYRASPAAVSRRRQTSPEVWHEHGLHVCARVEADGAAQCASIVNTRADQLTMENKVWELGNRSFICLVLLSVRAWLRVQMLNNLSTKAEGLSDEIFSNWTNQNKFVTHNHALLSILAVWLLFFYLEKNFYQSRMCLMFIYHWWTTLTKLRLLFFCESCSSWWLFLSKRN